MYSFEGLGPDHFVESSFFGNYLTRFSDPSHDFGTRWNMIFYSKLWGAGPCLFVGTHAIKFSELKGPNLVGIQSCCTSSEYKGVRICPEGLDNPS